MLARFRNGMDENEEGFTLIELLVVIIIIGILAAIAIPVFLNQRKKGYDAQAKSDIRNSVTAMETYLTDSPAQAYPVTGTQASAQLATNGYKRSANVSDVMIVVYDAPGSPVGAKDAYKLSAFSQSGVQWCFNSAGASTGIVKTATTGTIAAPPTAAQAGACV